MTSIIDPAITSEPGRSIQLAEDGADPLVYAALKIAIEKTAQMHLEFTTDDVLNKMTRTMKEPKLMGAGMVWAVKRGLCTNTGRVKKSIHHPCHKRPKAVWRSLIYQHK